MSTSPSKLKARAIAVFNNWLKAANIDGNPDIAMRSKIVGGHIATPILWDFLKQLPSVQIEKSDDGENLSPTTEQCLQVAISDRGDLYALSYVQANLLLALRFEENGQISKSDMGSWADIKAELGLTGEIWTLKKVISAEIVRGSNLDLKPKAEALTTDFVMGHFKTKLGLAFKIVGVSVVVTLIGVATPLGFQTFTDKILPYAARHSLIAIITLLILGAIAANILSCYQNYQQSILFAKYQNSLGKDVFARLMAMDFPYLAKHKVGELTKLVDQIEESSGFLVMQLLGTVTSVISLLVVLPLLFLYDVQLASIVFGIGLAMAFTIAVSLGVLRNRVKESYRYDASFQSVLIEALKGMHTIKALSNEAYFRHRTNHALEVNLYGYFNVSRLRHILSSVLGFQSQMITIAVIFFGAQSVFANQMTIGQLIAFNMLANNVVGPLVAIVMTAAGWENFRLARSKLLELVPPDESKLLDGEHIDLRGDIEFEDVWFRYPDTETWILKGINLTIKQGEIIGVVGSSGSGKSTMALLIMGFYPPTQGKITINGYDISRISPRKLRSRIASVQQTSFLFNNSVLENIHLGRLGSDYGDILEASKASGAEKFIEEMPDRYMTELAEDGSNLSGGQRQRLAIARALVRDADIMLFDEATSALDNKTEEQIKDTIYRSCQGRTGLIIAHRLNTLSYCQRLIVMDQGAIEASGTHTELLGFDNSYKRMWESMLKRDTIIMGQALEAEVTNAV